MDCMKFYKGEERFKASYINNIKTIEKFFIYIDDDYYNALTKTFFVMDNKRIHTTMTSMLKIVSNMQKTLDIINENNYVFQCFYIKDNMINIKVNISEEYVFDNTLKVFMRYCIEKTKFENNVEKNNHLLLSTYVNASTKVLIDFKCGHKPNYLTPNSYNNGVRCPVCANQKIENGVNDIATLRPDIVKYLKYKDDAFKYQPYSKKRILFKCDNCGCEKEYEINTVSSFGFSCPFCSDGISYPNKFISQLLSQLDVAFETEVKFGWCKFKKYHSHSNTFGRYDVVIEDKKIIIEMDGNLGHGKDSILKSKEEGIYIDSIKDVLAKQHNYKLIRIKCDYSNVADRFRVVKASILSSNLSNYIDLTKVNWDDVNRLSESSYVNRAIELFNSNPNIGAKDIGKILHVSTACASNYLKIGNEIGACEFNEKTCKDFRKRKLLSSTAKSICLLDSHKNIIACFASIAEYQRHYGKRLYVKENKVNVYGILYTFKYISKSEFNRIKRETPEKAFGDFFISEKENIS